MVLFPDPNGGSMNVANQAEAVARGWNPSMGTFGVNSDPAAGGGGSGAIGQSAGFQVNNGGLGTLNANEQAQVNAARASSGFSLQDLAERKRQFDATLEWQKQMWTNQGLPQLEIQQRAAALAQQEFEAQNALAQQNLQLAQQTAGQQNAATVAGLTGMYNAPNAPLKLPTIADFNALPDAQKQPYLQFHGANAATDWVKDATAAVQQAAAANPQQQGPGVETLASQQQRFQQGMAQSNLGLQYLQTAASMGGPADVFQADDFARGAASNGAPAFLQALRNNTGLAAFGATSGAAPTALTAGGLMDRLSGGSVDHSAALNAIGGIAQAGGAALAPQAMESLNPDEVSAMQSGFKKLGYSMPAFLQQYSQSRIGQGSAQAA